MIVHGSRGGEDCSQTEEERRRNSLGEKSSNEGKRSAMSETGTGVETGDEVGVRNREADGGCWESAPTTSSRNSSSADGELRR